jgi:transcriptional regulator with XRE-family HTH domain
MDDQQLGTSLRTLRIKRRLTQDELGRAAGVSRWIVARAERGQLATIPLGKLRAIAMALDARLDPVLRWQGGDLGRLLNARHSAMHDSVAGLFGGIDGWVVEPEVSFSIYGERGIIDVLSWHPGRRALLVIELKTELVDINELMGSVDRKRRLAVEIAHRRGWDPVHASTWVVIADSSTNRRSVGAHRITLRAKFPSDGRAITKWLHSSDDRVDALSFLAYVHGAHQRRDLAPIRRVRRRSSSVGRARERGEERPTDPKLDAQRA